MHKSTMFRFWSVFLGFIIFTDFVSAGERNETEQNSVVSSPAVSCGEEGLIFEVETRVPFMGEIFVRNEYSRQECRANFRDVHMPGGSMTLRFDECGMRRQRTLNPKGMSYTIVLVVKFHPVFLTKADRAYQIKCFYREAQTEVRSEIGVSDMTTAENLVAEHPAPRCTYDIRQSAHDGPVANFVHVGQPIVHIFRCDHSDMYGMLVKDCFVDDGKDNRQQIIDSDGCPLDEDIVEIPDYSSSLSEAIAEATVFKWPDQPTIYFTCQIGLCMKGSGECEGIVPPICGRRKSALLSRLAASARRQKRNAEEVASIGDKMELDLEVRKLIVLDIDDAVPAHGVYQESTEGLDPNDPELTSDFVSTLAPVNPASYLEPPPATTAAIAAEAAISPENLLAQLGRLNAKGFSGEKLMALLQEWLGWPVATTTEAPTTITATATTMPYHRPLEAIGSAQVLSKNKPSTLEDVLATLQAEKEEYYTQKTGRKKNTSQSNPEYSFQTSATEDVVDRPICFGPEMVVAFAFLLTVVCLGLLAITLKVCLPCLQRWARGSEKQGALGDDHSMTSGPAGPLYYPPVDARFVPGFMRAWTAKTFGQEAT